MHDTQLLSFFSSMNTVAFQTFGCKLNQSETAVLVKDFLDHGYQIVSWDQGADVVVLNSCTVTRKSDARCRQAIRHALRMNPNTTIIVVGCYAQVSADELMDMIGVDYLFGVSEKFKIFRHFSEPGKRQTPAVFLDVGEENDLTKSRIGEFGDQTRAFLKIQDGCDRRCTYCIVPFARGSSRSIEPESIHDSACLLIEKGFKEIVLTGVHIGQYGLDLRPSHTLTMLCQELMRIKDVGRLRLSSLDSVDVEDLLLDLISKSNQICRHFHIPLQSGSDVILRAMDRPYTPEEYVQKIKKIQSYFPDAGLGTDVMVGFPGETDDQFQETYRLIESLPFSYLHVFPYSRRPGTFAADLPGQIQSAIRRRRAKALKKLGMGKRRQFMEKWRGREVTVLLESKNRDGWMSGLTSEYLRVEVPYDASLVNQFVNVEVTTLKDTWVRGKILQDQRP